MIHYNEPIRQYEPLWGEWEIDSLIGEGSYGRVYKSVRHQGGQEEYCAIKFIQIPKTATELSQARSMGMDSVSLVGYFEDMTTALLREVSIMHKLRGSKNIVRYKEYQVFHEEGTPQWDIVVRMELLEPLSAFLDRTEFSETEVVRLGTEMCDALTACKQQNIIHRDVKESNIFVDANGIFKLGDFGIAREASERSRSMSMRGTPAYIAPEIAKGRKYSSKVDIYSLGILLYKLLNNGRYPFMPAAPNPIKFEDTEKSLERRLSGEQLPPPANGSWNLKNVILKACSYASADRFESSEAFKDALLGRITVAPPERQRSIIESTESSMVFIASDGKRDRSGDTRALFGGDTYDPREKEAPV